MKSVISTERLPIKLWTEQENIEESALQQMKNLANLPFAFHHIAIMPDVHSGYGMPIGGVLATQGNIIIPNAVGVDIGCGVISCRTNLKVEQVSQEQLKEVLGLIREKIPVGFKHQEYPQDTKWISEKLSEDIEKYSVISQEYNSSLYQLGTLGSGNHFVEIQKNKNNNICIMIHSGSRNLGKKVADYYNNIAKELNAKWWSSVSEKQQLAFLPIENEYGRKYYDEMKYCIEFAKANRRLMCLNILNIFIEVFGKEFIVPDDEKDIVDIAHNYASFENHFNHNVIVHRKGATLVREGTIGIIPGSQGTKSYIVKGKGNVDSFNSCSHGAGRKMSRTKAKENLSLEDEKRKLDEQGILHAIRGINDLDEASGAYKDIEEVIKNQDDLIEVIDVMTPLAVVKG